MKQKLTFLTTIILIQVSSIFSQGKIKYQSAIDAFKEGIEYYQKENYEYAYNAFAQINYNDTAYFQAQVLAITCASMDGRFDTIYNLANEVLNVRRKNPLKETFLNAKGKALVEKKKYGEAIEIFDNALKEYPMSSLLRYNRADAKYNTEDYNGAVEDLQDAIRFNPNSIISHSYLGDICVESGNLTKAALCYNAALLLNSADPGAHGIINKLEDLYAGDTEQKDYTIDFLEDEQFDDIDALIADKEALSPKYKTKCKLKFDFIKHNQLIFKSLIHNSSDQGFWSQNYVQIFSDIYTRGYFPDYSYYNSVTLKSYEVQKIIGKKIKNIETFINWSSGQYLTHMNNRVVRENRKYVDNQLFHEGQYGFSFDAELENGVPVGKYIGYSKNGLISTLGSFNSYGQVDGLWEYYDDQGNITRSQEFKDGKEEGAYTMYHLNGAREKQFNIKNNQIDGPFTSFYTSNQIYSTSSVDNDGKLQGISKYYHSTGQLSHQVDYENNQVKGELIKYFADGKTSQISNYLNGRLDGNYKSFYQDGSLYTEGDYDKGNLVGPWKFYHRNGKIIEEGLYKNNFKIGVWKEFNDAGVQVSQSDYGQTGKKTGTHISYDNNGNKAYELEYKGTEILSYKVYTPEGEIIKEGEKSKKYLEFENFYPNGQKMLKGNYYKSEKYGLWNYFNQYGTKTSEVPFNDEGLEDGTLITYFNTGEVDSRTEYKDGVPDGYYVEYYRNGKVHSQGWFVEGDKVGPWEYYHRDGVMRLKEYYLNGQAQGDVEYYNEQGHLSQIGVYYYGDYEGTILYDTLGNKTGEYFLKDGAGTFNMTDINGNKSTLVNYKGGVKHGEYKAYDMNGNVTLDGNFFNGERVGEWTYYYPNSKVNVVGSYQNGRKEGLWTWYDSKGRKTDNEEYYNGQIHGQDSSFYEDGSLNKVRSFRHGNENGKTRYYCEGKLQYIRVYQDDILLGYTYLDKSGNEMPIQKYKKGDFTIKTYYQSGKPSHESELKDGYSYGKSIYYYPNGNIAIQKTYVDDQLNGAYIENYNTGKIKKKSNYVDGDRSGELIEYWPNGKMKSKTNYRLDEKFGWAYEYDNTGKETSKKYYYSNRQLQ